MARKSHTWKQELAWSQGGQVDPSDKREYGKATISIVSEDCPLFADLGKELVVWMSHGDQLSKMPQGYTPVAKTSTAPYAAVQKGSVFGIQFHPEVTHTPQGKQMLKNFVVNICKANASWTMVYFLDTCLQTKIIKLILSFQKKSLLLLKKKSRESDLSWAQLLRLLVQCQAAWIRLLPLNS